MPKNRQKSKKPINEISKTEKQEQDFDSWLWGHLFYMDCDMKKFQERKAIYLKYQELKKEGKLDEFKYEQSENSGDLKMLKLEEEKAEFPEEISEKSEIPEDWEFEIPKRTRHPFSDSSLSDY
ncbi:unnamed protein product [Caenorhabditis nigoni]|uniref:Uncharacterized protein n=1 Tax=Caenorhabditis nigoni TaxID=1611254 RepID=A0A2G5TSZ4_9PELO|nr:hypothetical protein B9Z55_021670 [Caenorhabditis nigoni]